MENKRLMCIKRILDKCGIQYEVCGCVVTTEHRGEHTMRNIACSISEYVHPTNIIYNIRKTESFSVNECSLEIDTGSEREDILKTLEGIEYREDYGFFTTASGEVYITDVLSITPETSLRRLLSKEDAYISTANNLIAGICEANRALRNTKTDNPRYKNVMEERQIKIHKLEETQKLITSVREELSEILKGVMQQ